MVRKGELEQMHSSVAQTLDIVGDWWSLLILRDAFLGVTRFDDFHRHLGVARNILSARIKRLVEREILERQRYSDRPERFEYVLTERGGQLWLVIAALRQWGDHWIFNGEPTPFLITHKDCGGEPYVAYICGECGKELDGSHQTQWSPNLGEDDPDAGFWELQKGRSRPASYAQQMDTPVFQHECGMESTA
ncbi:MULTISPECIES: helix-turn-helix domain-containing protein [Acidithrix]|uniref:HTH-type transcriptional regulator YodB n=1 Tax=Acidithrix ferrooxidans TaxID=1280514 RepID=A0A0D8HJ38_9ACTN|nr:MULTISPECIES: helix-turn-helix domain-containing protein [Acidithrix]KJF17869.1 HTH-type transcriptional regulator YodB [Acidithrix ferrooxidans]CAG4929185.1 unnamed protein product [Acidithrix sp. C25]